MTFAAATVATLGALLAAPSAATPERPVASLSAIPARVDLVGRDRAVVTVRNVGRARVRIAARSGGLAVDARGRPRLVGRRGARNAAPWLAIHPRDFELAAGGVARIQLASLVPRRAEPGDHHAVLLLSTRAVESGAIGVRMRLGVRVAVRVPGVIVRRLLIGRLRVRRSADVHALEVEIANRGNVTEQLRARRVRIVVRVAGRVVAVLRPERPDLLPRTTGLLSARLRPEIRGAAVIRVEIGTAAARTFRARL